MPSSEAEEEAEVDDEAELLLADLEEDAVARAPGCSSIRRITISFTSSSWSMLSPISSVTVADDVGELLLHALVDRLADPRRQRRSRAAGARAA